MSRLSFKMSLLPAKNLSFTAGPLPCSLTPECPCCCSCSFLRAILHACTLGTGSSGTSSSRLPAPTISEGSSPLPNGPGPSSESSLLSSAIRTCCRLATTQRLGGVRMAFCNICLSKSPPPSSSLEGPLMGLPLSCLPGYRVRCEYVAHKEGVLHEEMVLCSESNHSASIKVVVQARVMDRHHGTPMLLEGVKCIGSEVEYDSEQSEWQGFD
uniref:Adipose-secreted signaling protein n=1 Tax=Naja naja TaxID=35670 RepID=A0A8C6XZ97_NAJNA